MCLESMEVTYQPSDMPGGKVVIKSLDGGSLADEKHALIYAASRYLLKTNMNKQLLVYSSKHHWKYWSCTWTSYRELHKDMVTYSQPASMIMVPVVQLFPEESEFTAEDVRDAAYFAKFEVSGK